MKMTKVISGPVLIVALLISNAAAAAKPTSKVAQERQQEDEFDFAAQDKEKAICEKLFKEQKYDECFEHLSRKIVEPLRLREESNRSWIAQQRLQEFTAFQKLVLKTRGKKLLAEAQSFYEKGEDQKAIEKAGEAKTAPRLNNDEIKNLQFEVNDVLKSLSSESDEIITKAQARLRRQKRADQVDADKAMPGLAANKREINEALTAAANLLKRNKLDEAREQVEKVFKLEPGNAEAGNLACKIYTQYYKTGYARSRADVASMMAYEKWQWVEPTFQRNSGSNDVPAGIVKTAGDQSINSKLDKIIFPRVSFNETDIPGVIAFLRKNKNYDYPDKEGVNITFDAGSAAPQAPKSSTPDQLPEPDMPAPEDNLGGAPAQVANLPGATAKTAQRRSASDIQVTLSASNVSLRQLLDYLCFLTDLSYSVQSNGVVFGATDSDLESRTFQIMPSAVELISQYGGSGTTAESAEAAAPEAAAPAAADAGSPDSGSGEGALKVGTTKKKVLSQETLKKFFQLYGITFPEKSSINYNANLSRIKMHNTEKNLRMMADLLRELNEDKPMVQIEVKSIVIADQDLQELGFNWSLGQLGSSNGGETWWAAGTGSNTQYTNDGTSVTNGTLSLLRSALSGVDSRLLNNLNIFPDLFGSFKPFGSDVAFNLSLTINALDRTDRSEMISAPRVLTSNNQKATVFLGKAYYFPTDWDELEIETEGGDGDSGYAVKITAPTPSFDESEQIGTSFTVTPTVLNDNYTIRLNIKPSIKAYTGQDTYSMIVHYQKADQEKEESPFPQTFSIWKPVISTREIDAQVDVYDGETLVLGGLVDSNTQSRLDKIPILGDLPLIGRLFQSHSERSKRVNTLIFVTARLVNNAGLPIRRINSTGGIPEVNR